MLSNIRITTVELTSSRLNFIQKILSNNGLELKYIILGKTVLERYDPKIENPGRHYSSTTERVINSISLILSALHAKIGLFFSLVTKKERTKEEYFKQKKGLLGLKTQVYLQT